MKGDRKREGRGRSRGKIKTGRGNGRTDGGISITMRQGGIGSRGREAGGKSGSDRRKQEKENENVPNLKPYWTTDTDDGGGCYGTTLGQLGATVAM